jgi:TP901 family phage tail tape measure protein
MSDQIVDSLVVQLKTDLTALTAGLTQAGEQVKVWSVDASAQLKALEVTANVTKLAGDLAKATTLLTEWVTSAKERAKVTIKANLDPKAVEDEMGKVAQHLQDQRFAKIKAEFDQASFTHQLEQLGTKAKQWAKDTGEKLKDFKEGAMALAAGGAAIAIPIGEAVKQFGDFEKSLIRVQSVSKATEGEMAQMKAMMHQIGMDTQFSAKQAGEGFAELADRGYKAQQMLSAMPGIVNLASAAQVSIGEAAAVTGEILHGFGMQADQATAIADHLAYAANNSAISISDLSESMKFVAPVAHSSNQSLGEVSAILMALANNGIRGTMGGTAVREMLTLLQRPSMEASFRLKELGISIQDTNGKMLPLTDIIDQLREKTAKFTEVKRNETIATIFGMEAQTSVLALMGLHKGKIEELVAAQEKAAGSAQRVADGVNTGLNFSLKQLQGSIETLVIKVGEDFAPAIESINLALTQFTNFLIQIPEPIRTAVETLAAIAAVSGLVAGAIGAILNVLPAVAAGFAALASPAGLAIIATAGLAAAVMAVVGALKQAQDQEDKRKAGLAGTLKSTEDLIKRYEELKTKTHLTKAEEEERHAILAKLDAISPDLVTGYDSQGRALDANTDAAKRYIATLKEQLALEKQVAQQHLEGARNKVAELHVKLLEAQEQLRNTGTADNTTIVGGIQVGDKRAELAAYIQDLRKEISAAQADYDKLKAKIKGADAAGDGHGGTTQRGKSVEIRTRHHLPRAKKEKEDDPLDPVREAMSLDDAKHSAGALSDEAYLQRLIAHQKNFNQASTEYWQIQEEIKRTRQDIADKADEREDKERKAAKDSTDANLAAAALMDNKSAVLNVQLASYEHQLDVLKAHHGKAVDILDIEKKIRDVKKKQTDYQQQQLDKALQTMQTMAGLADGMFKASDTSKLDELTAKAAVIQDNLDRMHKAGIDPSNPEFAKQQRELDATHTDIQKAQDTQDGAVPGFLAGHAQALAELPGKLKDMGEGLQSFVKTLTAAVPSLAPLFSQLGAALAPVIAALPPLWVIVAAVVAVLTLFALAWQQNVAGIQEAFGNLMRGVLYLWNALVNFLAPAVQVVGTVFSALFNVLGVLFTVVGAVVNGIASLVNWVWNVISAFTPLKAIIDGISWVFGQLGSAIEWLINWVMDRFGGKHVHFSSAGDNQQQLQRQAADQYGLTNADIGKILIQQLGTAVKQGLVEALGSVTSFNPLPVADVTKQGFFSVGPASRFFIEREVTLKHELTIQGTMDKSQLVQLAGDKDVRAAFQKAVTTEAQTVSLMPKFA